MTPLAARRTAAHHQDARTPGSRPATRCRHGFTLIEMLVVIVIIGILAAIALTVAGRVSEGARTRSTEDILRILDTMYTSYAADSQSRAPRNYVADSGEVYPIVDGRGVIGRPAGEIYGRETDPAQPTVTLFILHASKTSPGLEESFRGVDARFLERRTGANAARAWRWTANGNFERATVEGLVVKDAFGSPLRFVVPGLDGGPDVEASLPNGQNPQEFSRAAAPNMGGNTGPLPIADADQGFCTGRAPYFYSSGASRDPGERDDNVYTNRPQFQSQN